jgi:hypothetical protein
MSAIIENSILMTIIPKEFFRYFNTKYNGKNNNPITVPVKKSFNIL